MSGPVYLETWHAFGQLIVGDDQKIVGVCERDQNVEQWERQERAILAAAAPALVRALLAAEWNDRGECRSCDQEHEDGETLFMHEATCLIDKALASGGFPDQDSRDEAREAIREAGL